MPFLTFQYGTLDAVTGLYLLQAAIYAVCGIAACRSGHGIAFSFAYYMMSLTCGLLGLVHQGLT